jgi:glycosyltransferase involved in cell wall biosynthesis
MRILFLSDGLAPFVIGGMQQYSTQLIAHLAPLVERITLCHCGAPNAPVPEDADVLAALGNPQNVDVIGIPFVDEGRFPGHYLRASLRLSQRYKMAVGDLKVYDAVYAQGLMGDAFLGQHPKVLVNLHGLNMFQPSFSLRELLEKRLLRPTFRKQLRGSWKNVSLGGRLTGIIHQQDGGRNSAVVLPNGIAHDWLITEEEQLRRGQRPANRPLKYVIVGRNEHCKGLHVLQQAIELLHDPIELHMIGDWPRWNPGIHTVVYHEVVRDQRLLKKKLDACDVLLLPSLSEGMPTVVLEALARGLDVIATDVGAVGELVEGLVPPGDSRAFAEAIRRKNAAPPAVKQLKKFEWAEIAKETIRTIKPM